MKNKNKALVSALSVPTISQHSEELSTLSSNDYVKFGNDNLFPNALCEIFRASPTHRGIMQSKRHYMLGKGFSVGNNKKLGTYIENVNASQESLREVYDKLLLDSIVTGNFYIQIITNSSKKFLSINHIDATRCRKTRTNNSIVINSNWRNRGLNQSKEVEIAIYPQFTEIDGLNYSMVHVYDYEPEFRHYGLPDYVAALQVATIAYKTDKWNLSRLDNNFNASGILLVNGTFDDDNEALELQDEIKKQHTGEGNAGKIITIVAENSEKTSQFIPFTQNNDADFTKLHDQSSKDLLISHSWYASLCNFDYQSGFDTNRVLNEYHLALHSVIHDKQEKFLSIFKWLIQGVTGIDCSELSIINTPPLPSKPAYVKVWEARKIDGFDFDEKDPNQQMYIGQLTKPAENVNK